MFCDNKSGMRSNATGTGKVPVTSETGLMLALVHRQRQIKPLIQQLLINGGDIGFIPFIIGIIHDGGYRQPVGHNGGSDGGPLHQLGVLMVAKPGRPGLGRRNG